MQLRLYELERFISIAHKTRSTVPSLDLSLRNFQTISFKYLYLIIGYELKVDSEEKLNKFEQ